MIRNHQAVGSTPIPGSRNFQRSHQDSSTGLADFLFARVWCVQNVSSDGNKVTLLSHNNR
jgi:hypothetical protein